MHHEIPVDSLKGRFGDRADQMAAAISGCVHCGFCLAACPTYEVLGEEMDSPRGRIVLMKEALEGSLPLDDVLPHTDACLGCVACVTACPSGVEYGELLHPFRFLGEESRTRGLGERLWRGFLLDTLASRARFRALVRLGLLARPITARIAWFLPPRMRAPLALLPQRLAGARVMPPETSAQGAKRGRAALLRGCAQDVLEPEIAAAAARVLSANGVEVVVQGAWGCCGSLALHAGDERRATTLASRLFEVLPDDVDWVVTTAAGCGSGLRDAVDMVGPELRDKAQRMVSKLRDVSTLLDQLGSLRPMKLETRTRVAYQDACHLRHAQREALAPRRLLGQVEALELVEPPNPDRCCGSAGIYNLEQPELAAELGRRKAQDLQTCRPDRIVSGNIGCMTQLRSHLDESDSIAVEHIVCLLAEALEAAEG